jgi:hypothetical protein
MYHIPLFLHQRKIQSTYHIPFSRGTHLLLRVKMSGVLPPIIIWRHLQSCNNNVVLCHISLYICPLLLIIF